MTTKTLKTNVGQFLLTENATIFSIGGKNKCAQIKIESTTNPEKCELLWLETEKGGCELNNIPIRRDKTQHMMHLLLTYVTNKYPSIKKVILLDDSKLHCKLPDGRIGTYSMMFHNLAFYQKTYYEKNYDAKMLHEDEYKKYKSLIHNFEKSKPQLFSFNNPELDKILTPIWKESITWKDFFDKIKTIYGESKCTIVYPWIKSAIFTIFENYTIGQTWVIDIASIPHIIYAESLKGGNRNTRKKSIVRHDDIELSYDEIYNLPYLKY